jgi:hypothetical protein
MRIQAGWRYRAVVQGEGEFEGVLTGPAAPDLWAEGGGEVVMPRWVMQLDSGERINVQEACLAVLPARTIGRHPGPVACGACKGTGGRPKRGSLSREICGNCGGEGITYPDSGE